jgi:hypothetical protein
MGVLRLNALRSTGAIKVPEQSLIDQNTFSLEAIDMKKSHKYGELIIDETFEAVAVLQNISKYIGEHGITPTLISLVGQDLDKRGINLKLHPAGDAISAIEGMIDDVKSGNISAVLMRIIDAIADFINDCIDANRRKINELRALSGEKLKDIASVDTDKFSFIQSNILPMADFKSVVEKLSSLNYNTVVVSGDDSVVKSLDPSFVTILGKVGYGVDDDEIGRLKDHTLKVEEMRTLGWSVNEVKVITASTITALTNVRTAGTNAINTWKAEAKSVDNKITAEEAKAMQNRLAHIQKVIVVIERVSLVLADQLMSVLKKIEVKTT